MYDRRVGDQKLTFDFAEGLLKNNLLIVDRESQSIWSQLDGKAISGPMKETPLRVFPSIQTTWKHWREIHPDTKAMVVKGEEGRPYIYRNWHPGTPRPTHRPTGHDTSNLGLGLFVGTKPMFFPFRELEAATSPLKLQIENQTIQVFYEKDALTAWAEDAKGNLLPGVLAYEDGWLGFNPKSEIFHADISNK